MCTRSFRSAALPLLLAGLTLALGAPAVQAQNAGPDDAVTVRIADAAGASDGDALDALLRAHRLEARPFVHAQLADGMRAALGGDDAGAARRYAAAARVAEAFARLYRETSLERAVADAARWTADEQARKLAADSLADRAEALRTGRETLDEAHTLYLDALASYRALGDRIGEGIVLGGLGVVYWYAGMGDSTYHYFEQALAVRRAADDRQYVANSLNDLGSASRVFYGDWEAARGYYEQAAALREEIGDHANLGRTLAYLGTTYETLGDRHAALAAFERAAETNEAAGQPHRAVDAHVNAAFALKDLGRHSDALEHLQRALELLETDDDTTLRVRVLNTRGIVYRWLGDYEAALADYQSVLGLADASADTLAGAAAQANVGVVYLLADRPARAAAFFERAFERFEAAGDATSALSNLLNLGSALFEQGDYAAAEPRIVDAVERARALPDRLNESRALILHGNLLLHDGRTDEAEARLREGLELGRALDVPDLAWSALLGLGELYEEQEAWDDALQSYARAFDVLEDIRTALRTEEEKAGFLAQQRFAYEDVLDLLGRLHDDDPDAGYDADAFRYAEQAKARAFLDLLTESLANVRSDVDDALLGRQADLLAERARVREAQQALVASAAPDREAQTELRVEAAAIDDAFRTLQREMRADNPRYAALQYPEPADLDAVQAALLAGGAVLLAYAVGDSSSTLWAATADRRAAFRLPNRETLERDVELARYALSDPEAGSADRFAAVAHRLYQTLVAPAADFLEDGRPVIVVPDGILSYLPFEALLTASAPAAEHYADLPYLLHRHAVSYAPSSSVLMQLRTADAPREHPTRGLLAFGDPVFEDPALARLAYTGTEVERIAGLFPAGQADVFVQEDASERRLKTLGGLADYRYVHLATHGLVDERRPDYSGVALAGAGGEDGLLQAAEIFNLRLGADLVVLSACETGIGKLVRGEGLVGLTRAFMYAGAPSVVVSLWSVADRSTATLMEHFYGELITRERPKGEALRAAKLAVLREDGLAHPFHWAPFVLVGDWE